MSEEIDILKRCELFQQLTAARLSHITTQCRLRKLLKGSPVYLPNDEADGVLVLGDGRVKVSMLSGNGKEAILAFIEPGDMFGQAAVYQSDLRDEYAETMEPSSIVTIPTVEMRWLMAKHPDISLGVTKSIGQRLASVQQRLNRLMFLSNRDRLIHILLELAGRYGQPCDRGIELNIRLSHHHIGKSDWLYAGDGNNHAGATSKRRIRVAHETVHHADRRRAIGQQHPCPIWKNRPHALHDCGTAQSSNESIHSPVRITDRDRN